jgi:hypothetical protein
VRGQKFRDRLRALIVLEIWDDEGAHDASIPDAATKVRLAGNLYEASILLELADAHNMVLRDVIVRRMQNGRL